MGDAVSLKAGDLEDNIGRGGGGEEDGGSGELHFDGWVCVGSLGES